MAAESSTCPISTFSTEQHVQHLIKRLDVSNAEIAYVDTATGIGYPVVFFHGNPTSSYLWRNVIPAVSKQFRCLAPDLVGMGNSSKPQSDYRYIDHYNYIEQWMDQILPSGKVIIVCHDWGSGIAFNWCNRHQERVHCIIHMESIVSVTSWNHFPDQIVPTFQALRSPAGDQMVYEDNIFVETLLPFSIMRKLTDEEMECYRRPFAASNESRKLMLTFPRDIPFVEDGPQDVAEIVKSYVNYLSTSSVPKLCILSNPGVFSSGIESVTKSWQNHQFVTVKGLHFMQEDSPAEIAQHILDFIASGCS